jgi:hypothetical protein
LKPKLNGNKNIIIEKKLGVAERGEKAQLAFL